MALKQILFQFLPDVYWLCMESQISRQTVPDLGPSDHKDSRPKSSIRCSDSEATGHSRTEIVVGWLLTSQVYSQQPDTKTPFRADTKIDVTAA